MHGAAMQWREHGRSYVPVSPQVAGPSSARGPAPIVRNHSFGVVAPRAPLQRDHPGPAPARLLPLRRAQPRVPRRAHPSGFEDLARSATVRLHAAQRAVPATPVAGTLADDMRRPRSLCRPGRRASCSAHARRRHRRAPAGTRTTALMLAASDRAARRRSRGARWCRNCGSGVAADRRSVPADPSDDRCACWWRAALGLGLCRFGVATL